MGRRAGNVLLLPLLLLATILVTGCGIPVVGRVIYGTFSDVHAAERRREDVAILDVVGAGGITRILRHTDQSVVYDRPRDGIKGRFILTPDTYVIEHFVAYSMIPRVSRADVVQLRPGHIYQARNQYCVALSFGPSCRGRLSYTATIWIEDDTTRDVVAGQKW